MSNHPQVASISGQILPADAVIIRDGHPITTSLMVAKVFSKQHKHVLAAIENIECSQIFREPNFRLSSYQTKQNKTMPMYEITKDGFTFLVMGFTGAPAAEFKEAYIASFNAMEVQLRTQQLVMPTILISYNDLVPVTNGVHMNTAILNLTAAVERLTGQLAQANRTKSAPQQSHSKPEKYSPVLPFLNAWWHCLAARDVTAADLCRIIEGQQCPALTQAAADLFGPGITLAGRRLGFALRTWSQQTLEGFTVLNKGKAKNSVLWRLERTQ